MCTGTCVRFAPHGLRHEAEVRVVAFKRGLLGVGGADLLGAVGQRPAGAPAHAERPAHEEASVHQQGSLRNATGTRPFSARLNHSTGQGRSGRPAGTSHME